MPATNAQLAAIFREIADLLELQSDNPFRIRAYRRAAQAIDAFDSDLRDMSDAELKKVPGIGTDLLEKIHEFLATGDIAMRLRERAKLPEGVTELMRVPGLGPRRAHLIARERGITTVDDLRIAAERGELRDLPGFQKKTEENILAGITELTARSAERVPFAVAERSAEIVIDELRETPGLEKIAVAGSLRRHAPTIGDVDILAVANDPDALSERFTTLPDVARILGRGPTKSSVILKSGLQVDLRIVPPESWGAALQYFTGDKTHNILLRQRALKRGLTLSEYGLTHIETNERVAGKTEDEVYHTLGLATPPPETRVGRDEFRERE